MIIFSIHIYYNTQKDSLQETILCIHCKPCFRRELFSKITKESAYIGYLMYNFIENYLREDGEYEENNM